MMNQELKIHCMKLYKSHLSWGILQGNPWTLGIIKIEVIGSLFPKKLNASKLVKHIKFFYLTKEN